MPIPKELSDDERENLERLINKIHRLMTVDFHPTNSAWQSMMTITAKSLQGFIVAD
ncbi:MAG: hypothetical protein AB7J46_06235 [Candidatus Altimarinota bacterium]